MRPFDATHLTLVTGIAALAAGISYLCRARLVSTQVTRFTLGLIIGGNELFRYFHYGWRYPNDLPLHLCSIATWMAVIACFTLQPLAVEFAYFEGLAGATLALINPDMPGKVKAHLVSYEGIRYFVEHGGLVITACALIFGRIVSLRRGAAFRANYMWAGYVLFLILFNWISGANYLYLARKPVNPSLLDYLGPWPFYIVTGDLIAILLFWLLWIPVRAPSLGPENLKWPKAQQAPERQPTGKDA